MDRRHRNGMLLMLLASSGYAIFPILAKWLDAVGMQALDTVIWRFTFATPVVWLVIRIQRRSSPSKPLPRNRLLALGTLFSCAAAIAFIGLQRIPASTYVVLFFTFPAFVVLFSVVLGDRLPVQGWVALGLTMLGVMLIVPDFTQGLGQSDALGIFLALLNAIIVAIYFLLFTRTVRGHTSMIPATAWIITGAMGVSLMLIPVNGLQIPAEINTWILLLVLAVVSTALPVVALNTAIKMIGPTHAAILNTVEPVMAVTLATVLLGERMLPVQWLGAVLIITSVVILQTRGTLLPRTVKAESPAAGD